MRPLDLDAEHLLIHIVEVKSPKSVALPVVSTVINSILVEFPPAKNPRVPPVCNSGDVDNIHVH